MKVYETTVTNVKANSSKQKSLQVRAVKKSYHIFYITINGLSMLTINQIEYLKLEVIQLNQEQIQNLRKKIKLKG